MNEKTKAAAINAITEMLIAYSQPTIEKHLREYFKNVFLDNNLEEMKMTLEAIHKEVLDNVYEEDYLCYVLCKRLKLQQEEALYVLKRKDFVSAAQEYEALMEHCIALSKGFYER